jgi:hypothetical protein
LPVKNLDQRSLRELRQVDLRAVAQARDGLLVRGDRWKLRQQCARVRQVRGELAFAGESFDVSE